MMTREFASRLASGTGGGDAKSHNDQGQEQKMSVSNSIVETIQYPEASPISAKASTPDNWISRSPSTTDPFNNLINVCATLILIAILGLLELHIRRSINQSHPAVISSTREAVPGISWDMPAQSNAVARKLQKLGTEAIKRWCWPIPSHRPFAGLYPNA
jgi:hypothetical protein